MWSGVYRTWKGCGASELADGCRLTDLKVLLSWAQQSADTLICMWSWQQMLEMMLGETSHTCLHPPVPADFSLTSPLTSSKSWTQLHQERKNSKTSISSLGQSFPRSCQKKPRFSSCTDSGRECGHLPNVPGTPLWYPKKGFCPDTSGWWLIRRNHKPLLRKRCWFHHSWWALTLGPGGPGGPAVPSSPLTPCKVKSRHLLTRRFKEI